MKKVFDFSVYFAFTKTAFLNKMVYRFDYLIGMLNTCIQLFIACLIWKTLYGNNEVIDGISFSMVVTTIIISQGLSNAYSINDQLVSAKVRDGSIAYTLLMPISFRAQIFAETLGEILFRIISNFLPALIIFSLAVDILPPKDLIAFLMFLCSITLGFMVLWMISSIVQYSSFWILSVWSLSTIKNALIRVLSGAVIPLWFMPETIVKWVDYTPFSAIYFIPIRIYLGDISIDESGAYFAQQILWIIIMYVISSIMWAKGKQQIVIQGG
ncbi:ABC transporter permease [Psychromonas sp. PT13]|uniref:ABC transporter permease n=1 Tax=Psychromonas sp. PT13 TaxID=3439547 RepID=UPI003EBF3A0F